MGSFASKAALGATTEEPTEPEPKHLADLIQYVNETNMSVKHLADVLSEKARSSSWVVVFKALVTVHHLMVHGNERFIQHLASRSSLFTLHNFLDKSALEGYAMSTFIRRYSRYLNEKSLACRLITSDITKARRGMDGMMRTMDTKQLLNTLPVIQIQFDALLNFNANPDQLTNGIIHAAFMLLFKDSLRLFAAYNEGILNLLDKYFDMRKSQCKESLDICTKFLARTTRLAEFLKVAEEVGVDQKDIPYLTQAPYSLLEALKQHLASLEEKNDSFPPYSLQRALIPPIPNNPVVKTSTSRAWFSDYFPYMIYYNKHYIHKSANVLEPNGKVEKPLQTIWMACLLALQESGLIYKSHLRSDMKWPQTSDKEITGGMKWQLNTYTCTSTIWNHVSIPLVQTPVGAPYQMVPQPTSYTQPDSETSK